MSESGGPREDAEEPIDTSVHASGFAHAAAKVREFPTSPGVYLFKDSAGRVIYVGKATNLRARAGSYFQKSAEAEIRTAGWVNEICEADFLSCDSEVDAIATVSNLMPAGQYKSKLAGAIAIVGSTPESAKPSQRTCQ